MLAAKFLFLWMISVSTLQLRFVVDRNVVLDTLRCRIYKLPVDQFGTGNRNNQNTFFGRIRLAGKKRSSVDLRLTGSYALSPEVSMVTVKQRRHVSAWQVRFVTYKKLSFQDFAQFFGGGLLWRMTMPWIIFLVYRQGK